MDRNEIFNTMLTNCDLTQIKRYCFLLKVDFEELPGGSKSEKISELILYLERRGSIENLQQFIQNFKLINKFNLNAYFLDLLEKAQDSLADSNLKASIDYLFHLSDQLDKDLEGRITLLKRRLKDIDKQKIKGVISDGDRILEENRLADSILSVIQEIKEKCP